jgi:Lrp/AsnC family leucine-responsive transcriptional regulator
MQLSGIELDEADIALLNLLQADTLMTAEDLSVHVALSPSAITRRVRRLRASGLIGANCALLSDMVRQSWLRAVVQVQLHDHAPAAGLAALRRRLADCAQVQSCFEISGTFDLVLVVAVRDMSAYNALADELLAADPVVRRYETSFVKKELKFTTSYPIPAERPAAGKDPAAR